MTRGAGRTEVAKPLRPAGRTVAASAIGIVVAVAVAGVGVAQPAAPIAPLPERLSATGLYAAGSTKEIHPDNLAFSPQYPLWSDGATKRRWLRLPPGAFIDASRPDAWVFPPGTRLWKEFSVGRRVETRLIERLADGSWRFAAYVWAEDGSDATLAPAAGVAALAVREAPEGRYTVPGEADCRACHEGPAVPVLGFSALQLSPDRDPLAPHAEPLRPDHVTLQTLVARGLVRNLPPALLATPPRIAAASPVERAALGYLHANCGHCHGEADDGGAAVPVGLQVWQSALPGGAHVERVRGSMIDARGRYRMRAKPDATRLVAPGDAQASLLALRMRSRDPRVQMPPLGTAIADTESLALIERWIDRHLPTRKEPQR